MRACTAEDIWQNLITVSYTHLKCWKPLQNQSGAEAEVGWDKLNCLWYHYKWLYRQILIRLTGKPPALKRYLGKQIMSRQETNDCLRSLIVKGKPFMAGRLGSVELKAMRKLELPYLPSNLPGKKSAVINLCRNAGFFPEDIALERKFCQLMKQSCGQLDLAGVWFNPMEDYFLGRYGQPGLNMGLLGGLEPWY